MNAAQDPDRAQGLRDFDVALFSHIGFTISNAVRSFFGALTLSRIVTSPMTGPTTRFYEHINRFSASFAFATDVAMLSLGGYLKKKENLSARLGDVLSAMYLASMVLKHFENQGRPAADLPLVEHACRSLLYHAQEQLHGFLRNFPVRWLAAIMRVVIFPRGLTYFAPVDRLNPQIAELVMNPGEARERLCHFVYRTQEPTNHLGLVQQALELAIAAEPLEKKVRVEGVKTGRVRRSTCRARSRSAGGGHPHRSRGGAAARVRPQGHGNHQRRRLRVARAGGRRRTGPAGRGRHVPGRLGEARGRRRACSDRGAGTTVRDLFAYSIRYVRMSGPAPGGQSCDAVCRIAARLGLNWRHGAPDRPDVREFFRDALQVALDHQHLHVHDHTEHYIVNLLAMFSHTEALFEPDGDRTQLKPLALLLADAAKAPDDRQRFRTLQRLGDVALFVAGFLAGGFSRRPVDVDYHIAMGGRAYGTLAQAPYHGAQRVLGGVFAELAGQVPAARRRAQRNRRRRREAIRRATCCGSTSCGTRPAARARTACCSSSASARSPPARSRIEAP